MMVAVLACATQTTPTHSVDVVAAIASALLGINLAVVALSPVALESALRRRTAIEGARSSRQLRFHLRLVAASTAFFGVATAAALAFIELDSDAVYYVAYAACAAGVMLMLVAAAGVLRMLLRDLDGSSR